MPPAQTATATTEKQQRFLQLLDPVHDDLVRFANAMTRNRDEARDVASETVLLAFEHRSALREPSAFKSYLFTIARRLCRRRWLREKLFSPLDFRKVEDVRDTGSARDVSADVHFLYVALEKLPAAQRETVIMFEISGLSLEEICEVQGGTLSGVKSRLRRGRLKLAQLLGATVAPERQDERLP